MERSFNLIGPGRAGGSLAKALIDVGWTLNRTIFREDDPSDAAQDVELCVIATPDREIEHLAESVRPGDAVLMHLSGVTPLAVLEPHRAATLHPLVALPDPVAGAERLRTAWFAVAGDLLAVEIAEELSGSWFSIDDDDRALYHAAAVIASNHVVAVLGQARRVADEVGVPFEALLALVRATIENVAELGPAGALTGPSVRGDHATIEAHLAELSRRLPAEVDAYRALAAETRRLADQTRAD